MRVSGVVGCLTTAATLLGCWPGTLAYGGGLWAGLRHSPSKAVSGAGGDPRERFQNIAPREEHSDPPYGEQPPPLTSTTSSALTSSTSSSGEATSTSDGKSSVTCFGCICDQHH